MISWPTHSLSPVVKRNIEQLRATGAVRELVDAPHTYVIENFAWNEGWPKRWNFRDEAGHRIAVVLENENLWLMEPAEEDVVAVPRIEQPEDHWEPEERAR